MEKEIEKQNQLIVTRYEGSFEENKNIRIEEYPHHFSILLELEDGRDNELLAITKWEIREELSNDLMDISIDIFSFLYYVRWLCGNLDEKENFKTAREKNLNILRNGAPQLFRKDF